LGATDLGVIAITDHGGRGVAARDMAASRGYRFGVIVGEEITTRGGHLLGLFLERPVPALRSLRWSIAAIHEQGGLAVPAHPLAPIPMCATARSLRSLLEDADPAVHPEASRSSMPRRQASAGIVARSPSRQSMAWPPWAAAMPIARSTSARP
jgi:predicted metal-dependent phosphoesterase TrpH